MKCPKCQEPLLPLGRVTGKAFTIGIEIPDVDATIYYCEPCDFSKVVFDGVPQKVKPTPARRSN